MMCHKGRRHLSQVLVSGSATGEGTDFTKTLGSCLSSRRTTFLAGGRAVGRWGCPERGRGVGEEAYFRRKAQSALQ